MSSENGGGLGGGGRGPGQLDLRAVIQHHLRQGQLLEQDQEGEAGGGEQGDLDWSSAGLRLHLGAPPGGGRLVHQGGRRHLRHPGELEVGRSQTYIFKNILHYQGFVEKLFNISTLFLRTQIQVFRGNYLQFYIFK